MRFRVAETVHNTRQQGEGGNLELPLLYFCFVFEPSLNYRESFYEYSKQVRLFEYPRTRQAAR